MSEHLKLEADALATKLSYSIAPAMVAIAATQSFTLTVTNPSSTTAVVVGASNRDSITMSNLASLTSGNVSPQTPAQPWNFQANGANLILWVTQETSIAPLQSLKFQIAGVQVLSQPATAQLMITEYLGGQQAQCPLDITISAALSISAQAIPATVGLNQTTKLQWTTLGGAYVTVSPGPSGQQFPAGTSSTSVLPLHNTPQTLYTITVVQDASHSAATMVTVNLSPPIIDEFSTPKPTGLMLTDLIVIVWKTSYATGAIMQPNPGTPFIRTSDSATIKPSQHLAQNASEVTYTLTANGYQKPAVKTLRLQFAPMQIHWFRYADFNKAAIITNVSNAQLTSFTPTDTPCVLTAIGPGGPLTAELGGTGPEVQVLLANPATVVAGGATVLSYLVANVQSLSLEPGGQPLSFDHAGKGSVTVNPAVTTLYALIATNGATTVRSELLVPVNTP